ncbi:hypothetical protein LI951_01220 [Enterococcus sp. BWT-B8]|uniref:hypothetical protein n=1 Tax=Enterococcus sp. BWT-B8 TaxID=2885157 RepID=UPI001E5255F2|nr:hypothetical protein [Enterococcus sp. BWT-B8]MCB5950681.1 hypothetical protein [Enterococcus sp. BWT-B8]
MYCLKHQKKCFSCGKILKSDTAVSNYSLILEKELELFLNDQAILLNGDLVNKAFNTITKTYSEKKAVLAWRFQFTNFAKVKFITKKIEFSQRIS